MAKFGVQNWLSVFFLVFRNVSGLQWINKIIHRDLRPRGCGIFLDFLGRVDPSNVQRSELQSLDESVTSDHAMPNQIRRIFPSRIHLRLQQLDREKRDTNENKTIYGIWGEPNYCFFSFSVSVTPSRKPFMFLILSVGERKRKKKTNVKKRFYRFETTRTLKTVCTSYRFTLRVCVISDVTGLS